MDNYTNARDLAELGFLQQALEEAGMPARLIEPNEEVPIPALLATPDTDDESGERYLTFNFVPLDDEDIGDIRLLQLYTIVAPVVVSTARTGLAELLMAVNSRLPLGHFSLNEAGELYYRYVWAVGSAHKLPQPEALHVIDLFLMTLGMFASTIGEVASGSRAANEAIAALNS
ncbi:YbjN domain-containing protein [Cohnella hashimotonis]|uniref:YbjN domain-containing protein n=1 Tax=Cohnella hashimotonis TaxID=2826895 RepID=A0ABT6TFR3_9BACL|nr:YbjN domain-containing protein [Cohnella hashimotonis]MDI4645656.1 YbjN domain-containing protein [Cohnella hashimotonis]